LHFWKISNGRDSGKGSTDPLHVWFYDGVFKVGRPDGIISGWAKSKMVAGGYFENFKYPYLGNGSPDAQPLCFALGHYTALLTHRVCDGRLETYFAWNGS